MTPRQLESIGVALFGTQWQSDLARALGCGDRTIRHWALGTRPVPDGTRDALRDLLRDKSRKLNALSKSI